MVPDETDNFNKLVRGKINRAMRRQKPPTDNKFTKATHRLKKERNAPNKQQRKNAAIKARKARRESYSQVS